jgi:hypothetical protein
MEEAHLATATIRRLAVLVIGLLMISGAVFASSTHRTPTLRLIETNGVSTVPGEASPTP